MQTLQDSDPLDALIRQHPFLADIDPRFAKFYYDCANIRRFAAHQQIFQEGGHADHLYLILHGLVALETFVPDIGLVTIQSIGPGEALGWSWLFEPYIWHFTARTETPTEVISFDAAALQTRAAQDLEFQNDLLIRITKTLVKRLHATRLQLIDPTGTRFIGKEKVGYENLEDYPAA